MQGKRNPVQWFEIPVSDLARAKSFYEEVLGAKLTPLEQGPIKMAWFPRDNDTAGSSGGLIEGPGRTPSKAGALVYFTVADIDTALAKVSRRGGKTILAKASGDYGSIAHFEDCEGNLVALHAPA
jgi:predicted enzyme related to lactoylglutathione lyase